MDRLIQVLVYYYIIMIYLGCLSVIAGFTWLIVCIIQVSYLLDLGSYMIHLDFMQAITVLLFRFCTSSCGFESVFVD